MRGIPILLTAAALATAAGATAAGLHGPSTPPRDTAVAHAPPPPALPPGREFARTVTNPWFPLRPGTVFISKGADEGTPAKDVLRVTHRTKRILGVRATVIDDRLYEKGYLEEHTHDWYAQDKQGNVWYLGEDTATLTATGKVKSTEGTWQAGVHGARAGIFMPAHPRVGDGGWQEFYKGHAQDRYRVISLRTRVRAPAASSRRALLTRETTPLEPGVVDHKIYVRGFGTVREETVKGGHERYELVAVHRP